MREERYVTEQTESTEKSPMSSLLLWLVFFGWFFNYFIETKWQYTYDRD